MRLSTLLATLAWTAASMLGITNVGADESLPGLRTGVVVTPRNFPNHTAEDVADMFRVSAEVGNIAVIRIPWNDPNLMAAIRVMADLARQNGLEPVIELSPDNPQIPSLNSRVDALRKTIASEGSKVAGADGSLTSKSAAYDRLQLEKVFAERQLATALAALETARNEAQRKQLYLERLVQPNLPDKALEPRRLRSVLMVFALGLVLWGVASLVVASVKEHAD